MRKLLWVVAVGALVLTVAAPAMALDFKFGSELRFRLYDYGNIGFDSNNTLGRGNPRGIQTRIRPRFDVSDDNGNITATMRFEYGDTEWGGGGGANGSTFGQQVGLPSTLVNTSIAPSNARVGNGSGGSAGMDGVGLETKWAYIDFAMPFGIPLRVRVGQQPWYLPKGLIVDDDFAGIRAYGTVKPVTYEAFWYRAARGNATSVSTQPGFDKTRDNAYDFYGGKIDVAIASWLNPGIYYVYGDNRVNCANNTFVDPRSGLAQPSTCPDRVRNDNFFGFTATGMIGIVSYDFDFVYGEADGGITGTFGTGGINTSGNVADPVKVKGYALDAGVHIPIGPLKFNILGTYASGDKQDGGDSEAFPLGPGPSWSGAGGQYELIGEGGAFDVVSMTQHNPTNLWMAGLTIEYVPVKALWIKLAYGWAGFTRKSGNCANVVAGSTSCYGPLYVGDPTDAISNTFGASGKTSLGQELHLRADYTIWTGFKIQGMVGYLFPSAGDTASKYILQFYYNF